MAGLFGKAMKDATFSVTTTSGGSRTFDTGIKMTFFSSLKSWRPTQT